LKRSNRLILLIGVFLAVVAFVLIVLLLGQNNPPTTGGPNASPQPIDTVIAAKDIALGATITEDMLTVQKLEPGKRNAGAFQDPSQIIGQIAREQVTAGQQITSTTLNAQAIHHIEVPPGQRAMSVQVDAVSGVGTAIQAGDYVDMVIGLTGDAFPVVQLNPQDKSIQVVAGLNNTSVKLIVEGLQVLGTVQPQTESSGSQNQNQNNNASPSATPSSPGLAQDTTELVVLSVTAQQAEVIKFAQMQGNISLVLRSPKDFFDENGQPVLPVPAGTTGVILKTLVDEGYGVLRPQLVEAILPTQP
jgi:Flp pilus assembly protein CpaB